MAFAPHECLSSVPSPPKPSLPANSCGFGILSSPRPAANAVRKSISRPLASLNVALIGDRAEQCDMPALCCVCLANGHETSSCPFIYCSSNITGAKPTDKPAEKEKSYSGAAKTGKLVDTARKAEEDISRTK